LFSSFVNIVLRHASRQLYVDTRFGSIVDMFERMNDEIVMHAAHEALRVHDSN